MIKKWLKILPVICLLTAQLIIATHMHSQTDTVSEHECVFCQTAAKLAGSDIPETFVVAEPVYYQTEKIVSLFQTILYFNFSHRYDTRAPPLA